jgi:hypothetical protein
MQSQALNRLKDLKMITKVPKAWAMHTQISHPQAIKTKNRIIKEIRKVEKNDLRR